jgi:hypothetical protein
VAEVWAIERGWIVCDEETGFDEHYVWDEQTNEWRKEDT